MKPTDQTPMDRMAFFAHVLQLPVVRVTLVLLLGALFASLLSELWSRREFVGAVAILFLAMFAVRHLVLLLPVRAEARRLRAYRAELEQRYPSYGYRGLLWGGLGALSGSLVSYARFGRPTDWAEYGVSVMLIAVGLGCHFAWKRKGIDDQSVPERP